MFGVEAEGMTEEPADEMIKWETVRALETFYSEVYERVMEADLAERLG